MAGDLPPPIVAGVDVPQLDAQDGRLHGVEDHGRAVGALLLGNDRDVVALAPALQLFDGPARGGTVAILLRDSGLRYLFTDLWA